MSIEFANKSIKSKTPIIERKESYNHRTTALVVWTVWYNGMIVRQCATRKEAKQWVEIYSPSIIN
jgi:hypothetical protein